MIKRLGLLVSVAALAAGCAQTPPTVSAAAAPVSGNTPAWQQGRAADMAGSTLAPLAGKLTVTPAPDIPLHNLKLPPGFKAELWATGAPGARAMARSPSGKIYVGTRGIGRVYEIGDNGASRTVRIVADKLTQPAVTFHNGSLYVFAIDKVLRYDGIDANPGVQPVDLTAKFNLPPEQHHNWKYVRFGPDGKIYVPFGAPCNICIPGEPYAQIRRYNADGSGMEVIARGVRNTQGFDWHPVTKELWFSDHGRDWMGDDTPEDELNRLSRPGQNFGFPYCHANGVADRDIRKGNACDGVTLPVKTMGGHAAVMGVHFYTGTMFPPEYRNALLVARKGSWNRTRKNGYDVVVVRSNPDGSNAQVTPFVTGFMNEQNQSFWGRPVYFLQQPDGSLLLSDEQNGAVYRITYAGT
ncbi:sorbosone dehydrogenase family protein [Ramlibacter sp. RBP-2]|uniref:Sorbosone dehydrogenase family protein n=1 Tax=Ramlibacter lithotrophicus TaxID=2606681 RepID=A0A7X6DJH0_9BURK|nr:PQQ-dependent sugar dehydrogenase [Ramlibacter lithotrophicus]NKE68265.1 sorbosone dehydrogenase family protein [Ramlibacter lithotrophicus]